MSGSAESDSVGGSKAGKKLRNPSAESGLCQIKIEDNVTQGRSMWKIKGIWVVYYTFGLVEQC